MRIVELVFLIILVVYHAILLAPRHRRIFALNYLVFAAGIALGVSLGLEGLRWQMLPGIAVLLIDLLYLFPTLRTLRGQMPNKGFFSALARGFRSLVSSAMFLLAVGCAAVCLLFPLPQVPLSGGLAVGFKTVHFPAASGQPSKDVLVWYPASGSSLPLKGPETNPEVWEATHARGGLPAYWQAYLEHSPSRYVQGGKLAKPNTRYPAVLLSVPSGDEALEFSWLATDLASRGFVVVAARSPLASAPMAPFSWSSLQGQLLEPVLKPELWLEPERSLDTAPSGQVSQIPLLRLALVAMAQEPGDLLYEAIDLKRVGSLAWKGSPGGRSVEGEAEGLASMVFLGDQPKGPRKSAVPELWVTGQASATDSVLDKSRWVLLLQSLHRADLTDAAYTKPFLAFFGLKSQADGRLHSIVREYLAAFFQFTLWGGDGTLLDAANAPVPGVRLLRK